MTLLLYCMSSITAIIHTLYILQVEQYNNDPLIYRGSAKASWAAALFRAVDDYQPHLQEFKLPLLVIHGTDDRMVPIAASDLVINTATSTDKTFEVILQK